MVSRFTLVIRNFYQAPDMSAGSERGVMALRLLCAVSEIRTSLPKRFTPGNFSSLLSSSCVLRKVAQCHILPCSQPWLFCCKVSSSINNKTMQRVFHTLRRVLIIFYANWCCNGLWYQAMKTYFTESETSCNESRSGATHLVMYN